MDLFLFIKLMAFFKTTCVQIQSAEAFATALVIN
jgi:hypothetical protein